MAMDFSKHLGSVERRVVEGERDGQPVRHVMLERLYDTTPEDLWDALTNPERLPRWFLPVTGDLQQGGRYQLEGNAGGTISECEPPRRIDLTWEFGGGVSWVEVRVSPGGESGALLTLSHICPVDDFWREYGPGAVGVGWDLGLIGLQMHLAHEARLDEEALAASPEGKALVAACSADWSRAAVACGEDPAHAGVAARRTTAFYTGDAVEHD